MAKKLTANIYSEKELEERKKFYKMLLAPSMSLEDKRDELGDLADEDLALLLEEFQADEEFELCLAFKAELDDRKSI